MRKSFMDTNLKITPQQPSFGKFIKVKGDAHSISHFRNRLKEEMAGCDYITLATKKRHKKQKLYIISKKDFDKFIDLTKTVHFFELRTNLEYFMKKKPKTYTVEKARKQLNEHRFKI